MTADPIPVHLLAKLRAIEPSRDGAMAYYPCRVALRNGRWLPRVYVVPRAPFAHFWGAAPAGRSYVAMRDVVELEESPERLPARFANVIYQAGESGMGYYLFRVEFRDGTERVYVTGNAVDFIPYPSGLGPGDIRRVRPHASRDAEAIPGADHAWCLFDETAVPT